MRAMVYERYGEPDVIERRELPVPTPGDHDLLVRVRAVSINASDWETLRGRPMYTRIGAPLKPRHRVLGSDVAGVVTAVGDQVAGFRPGDEVIADLLYHGSGGFADYAIVPDGAPIALKPPEMSFEDASTLPQAGAIAVQTLGAVPVTGHVLINGAGGGSGTFALQLAKAGAASVTAVDNEHKLAFLRSLGADTVVDYAQADYTRMDHRYDRIIDLAGHRSIRAVRRALAGGGTYSLVGGSVSALLQAALFGPVLSRLGDRKLRLVVIRPSAAALTDVLDRVAAGDLKPVIDSILPLDRLSEGLSRVGRGKALGKVVISVSDS